MIFNKVKQNLYKNHRSWFFRFKSLYEKDLIYKGIAIEEAGLNFQRRKLTDPVTLRLTEAEKAFLDRQRIIRYQPGGILHHPEEYGFEVEDVVVDTHSGALLTEDRCIIKESYKDPSKWEKLHSLGATMEEVTRHEKGCSVVINGNFPFRKNAGYYHKLVEGCLKLFYLDRLGMDINILVNRKAPDIYARFFELFDWEHLSLTEVDERFIHLERSLTTPVPKFGRHAPAIPAFTFEDFDRKIRLPEPGGTPRRLYIARRSRNADNMRAIESLVGEYGFEKVFLEEYSLRNQARLFRETEAVIGIHGAGLANITFSPRLKVIELANYACVPSYFLLARQRGHEYHYLLNEGHDAGRLIDPDEDHDAFYRQKLMATNYDVDKLDRLLRKVLPNQAE